jgi:glycine C-acetyltransferase
VRDELNRLENANLYRRLSLVSKSTEPAVVSIDGIESINLSSNDYLGLSENKTVLAMTIKSLKQVSQCSSRLVAGNSNELIKLENTLADHRKTDRALIYPNGYMANIGVISTLANKSTTIFSDEYNHASIIDGCRLSGARIEIFKHNDLEHLERLVGSSKSERKIILTETIFSMDGDQSNLKRIHEIALSHNAMSIVDDSHGDFIFDHTHNLRFTSAKGACMVDVYISSLSKALGCFGGYVAASQEITELLINRSRSFIYSSALPSHLCSSAIAAIPIAYRGKLQKKLIENINFFTSNINKIGFKTDSDKSTFRTQIIPLIIGDEKLTMQFSKTLLSNGIFIQAIRYPTVKLGFARLRASITAMLRKEQLSIAIEKIETIGKRLNII